MESQTLLFRSDHRFILLGGGVGTPVGITEK